VSSESRSNYAGEVHRVFVVSPGSAAWFCETNERYDSASAVRPKSCARWAHIIDLWIVTILRNRPSVDFPFIYYGGRNFGLGRAE
jgi:hypothetical protein